MNYEGFGKRFVAVLIDAIIIGIVNSILGSVLSAIFGIGVGKSVQPSDILSTAISVGSISTLISLALAIGYYVFYQASAGQTLGKKAMGLKVVDQNGKTPPVLTFFVREIIGKFVSAIILGIGFLMVLWDGKKQGLHDKIAGTYVVKA